MNEIEQSMKEFRDNLQRLNISTRNLVEDGDKKQKQIDVSLSFFKLLITQLLYRCIETHDPRKKFI
jgi:hypothetical protein